MTGLLPLGSGLRAPELVRLARAGNAEIQEAVARHANAPGWLLGELAEWFPDEVLRNPALPLLRLAEPRLLEGWPARSLERLAAQREAPAWLLRQAARHPVIDVQLAVALQPQLPDDVVFTLSGSPFWTIRECVARMPDLPDEVLGALVRDVDYGVRLSVAGRMDLPEVWREALRLDAHPLVRAVIHMFDLERDGF